MKSATPKVLHRLCGRPLIGWVMSALAAVEPQRTLVVLGRGVEAVSGELPRGVETVLQEQQLGTGDAVRSCRDALADFEGEVLVLYGDMPLVSGEELLRLLGEHRREGAACTLMTVVLDDPGHYGRIRRGADGSVERIVEYADAGEEERQIREVNAGVYVFAAEALWRTLAQVESDNAQGEVYITDAVGLLVAAGEKVHACPAADTAAAMGVNSRLDLARAAAEMRRRILERHMLAGVTVVDPAATYVEADVEIGRDTVLEPMTVLRGETRVGEGCSIGPSATVVDTVIGDGVTLVASHVVGAEIADGCNVGPFAYLRPGARLERGAKAGTFVEIKNSRVGEGAKVPHLSYVGDAEIGSGTNIGAGNITANYDGVNKHPTRIGDGVHTGADTIFVAPVDVGDGAMTGAGSVITGDVPAGDLGIARARQRNVAGYARKKRKEQGGTGESNER